MNSKVRALSLALLMVFLPAAAVAKSDKADRSVGALGEALVFGAPDQASAALIRLVARGKPDIVPTLILASRFRGMNAAMAAALSTFTGAEIKTWRDAMLWQEGHPELTPHPSYRAVKVKAFEKIDPNFMRFLGGDRSKTEKLKIRLEEITWGGVRVDGIPSLDNPKLITAKEATYLVDSDLVFGVKINGDTRAYPLRIMGWHEMFNEVIGGVPVALAYCTLCGAGILFETKVEGRDKPLVFGSSGFLYRSNKLMFDRETDSLWNQFTGEPVSGPLVGSGIKLKIRPVAITSWKDWKTANPETKVLSLETGHNRDYGSGVVYKDYFSSPDLMFPTIVRDETRLKRKDFVFGIREVGAAKAWPISAFKGGIVLNDAVGTRNVVLIGNAETRTVRAYDRGELKFEKGADAGKLKIADGVWQIAEDALIGPKGERLARVPGHVSYWFAWDGYLGVKSELYGK